MNKGQVFLLFALVFLSLQTCNRSSIQKSQKPGIAARNVIFIVGDGMGLSQISASYYSRGGTELSRCENIGIQDTEAEDNLVTDSAAGATAFATGQKTYNGAISVDSSGNELRTLFEEAHERSYLTGLAVTSQITHATPACFYAHEETRRSYENIAEDYLNARVDYAVGYGRPHFAQREDERDLVNELETQGVAVYTDIASARKSGGSRIVVMPEGEPPRVGDRPVNFLKDGCALLLEQFDARDEAFTMLVEGSQIDWAGHANESDWILAEMADFEAMLQHVLDWAEADGETLVVITADHETGGYAINGGSQQGDSLSTAFTTGGHTATLIPVFATGPGSDLFRGMYDNTALYHKLREALGWNTYPE
jgi:alkaline phosphatase